MINLLKIFDKSLFKAFLRLPLKLIPKNFVLPILQGRLRGKKWIKGSGVNSYWLGTYELEKQKLFQEVVKKGDVVFDIGGHVGFYTLLASKLIGKEGKVFAFEPLPRNIYYLKRHIEMNKNDNVYIIEAVVSDKNGFSDFKVPADSFSGRISNSSSELKVKSVTIDILVCQEKLPTPNIIKIDVEGAEILVLRGASYILKKYRPNIFLAVHDEKSSRDCLNFLKRLGYNLRSLSEKNIEDTNEIFAYSKMYVK